MVEAIRNAAPTPLSSVQSLSPGSRGHAQRCCNRGLDMIPDDVRAYLRKRIDDKKAPGQTSSHGENKLFQRRPFRP